MEKEALAQAISQNIVEEFKRRIFSESVPRLIKSLGHLTEEEIWIKPNSESNSVGNLVLHLCGNVSQYILSGIGGLEDKRERSKEFKEKGPIPATVLIEKMEGIMSQVSKVINHLSAEDLVQEVGVQGFRETKLSIIIHVIEHFSYHVGQISYFVKLKKEIDLNY
ncbi:MAG: DUF1572 domain-containing protein [Flammeovirgaceae bacterium]|nr:DUF1572 domain-containing protein [Flammeovirgaceae bacterium]